MKRPIAVSAGLVLFVLVGAGQVAYGLAGSIVAWGSTVVVPQEGLTDLVAIAAGGYHSLGLKSDGSTVAWGYNYHGECNVAAPNRGFVAVARGYYYYSFALKGLFGDADVDGRVDLDDLDMFIDCLSGPGVLPPRGCGLTRIDGDWNVDLADFAILQRAFSPPPGQ